MKKLKSKDYSLKINLLLLDLKKKNFMMKIIMRTTIMMKNILIYIKKKRLIIQKAVIRIFLKENLKMKKVLKTDLV